MRKSRIVPPVALALGMLAALAPGAQAGGQKEEHSQVDRLQPAVSGIALKVTGGDRYLVLRNQSGRTVLVQGYASEPYLRFQPSGVVEANFHSPSKYVNDDRYGLTPVPQSATAQAKPRWKPVARNGSYTWFDHRIHSMVKGVPKQVKDTSQRTKIFDWTVPMEVGAKNVTALGTLEWIPASNSGGGLSTGAVIAIVAAALAALAALALLLTRRRRRPAAAAGAGTEAPAREEKEVW